MFTDKLHVELERLEAGSVKALQDERDSHTSTVWRKDPVQSFLAGLFNASAYGHLLSHAEILAAENAQLRRLLGTSNVPQQASIPGVDLRAENEILKAKFLEARKDCLDLAEHILQGSLYVLTSEITAKHLRK